MPEKLLPIYQIQDFRASAPASGFYLQALETHLQEHAFIQKPHKHDFFIVLLITRGTGTHTIDFNTFPVKTNTIFFLSPGQVHGWQLSADTTGFVIFFSMEFYLLGFPQKKLFQFPFFNTTIHKPVLELSENEGERTVAIIGELKLEYENRNWKQEDILRDLLDIMLIRLSRIFQKNNPALLTGSGNLNQIQILESKIEKHYKEHLPVNYYAEKLHLTPKQLNEMCKQVMGKTSSELLQDRLVLEARRLLIHSDLTISQIAAELGYLDNSYFTRFFKKQTGQTPEQFRQNAQ